MKIRGILLVLMLLVVASMAFAPAEGVFVEPSVPMVGEHANGPDPDELDDPLDWIGLVYQLLGVVLVFFAGKVLPRLLNVLEAYVDMVQARIGEENLRRAQIIIANAVRAAEQLGLLKTITDKKAWALEKAQKWLDEAGIEMDLEEIDDLVEAWVNQLFGENGG